MITFPKAKINFGLRISGERPDGYHDIETIFYPVSLCDALEFVVPSKPSGDDELVVTGLDIRAGSSENLVIKAVRILRSGHDLPYLKIHLHKAIPAGAGLGGGSSDAAQMLKSVNRHFNLGITDADLRKYALDLGSDCPFFLDPEPSIARGRGEILSRTEPFLKGFWLVLVNPGINVSTREAYLNTGVSKNGISPEKVISAPSSAWNRLVTNDFEGYVFRSHPDIGRLKKALYDAGAILSLMSGTGSTVYGLFRNKPILPEKLRKHVIFEGVM